MAGYRCAVSSCKVYSSTNLKDAIDARKQAEEKYFGEYSYDNSMSYSLKHTIE